MKKKENLCPICKKPMDKKSKFTCRTCYDKQRNNKPGAKWQDSEWLNTQYTEHKLSFERLAELAGCSPSNIKHYIIKFGVKTRPSLVRNPELGRGEGNPRWKGGRVFDASGYVRIFHPNYHPFKHGRYVHEHILVMESKLGRKMKSPEVIHHKNGIKDDNHLDNLQLFPDNKSHKIYEGVISLFAKRAIFGDATPHLKRELQLAFSKFYSSFVNER